MRKLGWLSGALCALLLWSLSPGALAVPPPGFTDQTVLTGLSLPMQVTFLPDGRMLVLQKGGAMLIADPSTVPAVASPYMTITDIDSGGERGLTSIALDPDFAENDWFYVYYPQASSARNRIARFTHLGSTGDLASETLIWEDNEPFSSCCHYGGGMAFAPDGTLWLTTGEEFDGFQAQDLTRAGGKLIRINKDGTIPTDNPIWVQPGALGEIYAYGLRNPFRASFDLPTNRFLIAEVGGNQQAISWEDLHLGQSGVNYGWPWCEGPCLNSDFPVCSCLVHDDPLFTYPHLGLGASITGGFVYRGEQFPPSYRGVYFFGDYVRQFLAFLTFDAALAVSGAFAFDADAGSLVAMAEGPEGALYYVDINASRVARYVFDEVSQCELSEVRLDGVDDWIDLPDLSFAGDFTLEAWVYLDPGINAADAIAGQDAAGQDLNFGGGRLRLSVPGDVVVATTAAVPNTWTHYAVTRAGTTLRLYVNGVEDATGIWAGTFAPSALARGNAGFLSGRLEEVRLWNAARTAPELLASRDTTLPPDTPGLVAYYKFAEDAVLQEVFDATGRGDQRGLLGATPVVDEDDPSRAAATAPVDFTADCPTCPCEDVNRDAAISLLDAVRLSRQLEALAPPLPQSDLCTHSDVHAIRDLLLTGGGTCP